MENDASRMSLSGSQATDSVPEVDTIGAMGALHWAMMHGESYGITLTERNDFGPRLHAWPLPGEYELTSREVSLRVG